MASWNQKFASVKYWSQWEFEGVFDSSSMRQKRNGVVRCVTLSGCRVISHFLRGWPVETKNLHNWNIGPSGNLKVFLTRARWDKKEMGSCVALLFLVADLSAIFYGDDQLRPKICIIEILIQVGIWRCFWHELDETKKKWGRALRNSLWLQIYQPLSMGMVSWLQKFP